MSLIDALQAGVNLSNSSNQGVQQAARAKYAFPMEENKLYELQTRNKYLPDQLSLANQHQSLINKYYGDIATSNINSKNASTKYMPLKMAIDAQRALNSQSRFSDANQLIKYINSMKQADQDIYLSDPENSQARDEALKMVREGINNPEKSNNLITPDFLRKFGLGKPIIENSPSENQNPMGDSMPPMQPPMKNQGGIGYSPMQQINENSPMDADMQNNASPSQGLGESHPAAQEALIQNIAEDAPNKKLSAPEKLQLARQSLVNQKQAGSPLWSRAQGSVVLENFLQDNQSTYAPRLMNAAKFAGVYGATKKLIAKGQKESPQDYLDYKWVVSDFVPNLGNNIKIMEKLSSTNQQRIALNEMQTAALKWDIDPKGAVKMLNMGFDLFKDQARSTLKAAQPIYPGVLEKLNGLSSKKEDYIKSMVKIQTPNGIAEIPADKLEQAIALGAKRID